MLNNDNFLLWYFYDMINKLFTIIKRNPSIYWKAFLCSTFYDVVCCWPDKIRCFRQYSRADSPETPTTRRDANPRYNFLVKTILWKFWQKVKKITKKVELVNFWIAFNYNLHNLFVWETVFTVFIWKHSNSKDFQLPDSRNLLCQEHSPRIGKKIRQV